MTNETPQPVQGVYFANRDKGIHRIRDAMTPSDGMSDKEDLASYAGEVIQMRAELQRLRTELRRPAISPEAPELLPCPFCGGAAKIVEGEESAYVQCTQYAVHMSIPITGDNAAALEAAEMWNTRRPVEQFVDLLQKIVAWDCFPATGKTWNDGSPMSYAACYGSNGERNYIRSMVATVLAVNGYDVKLDFVQHNLDDRGEL